MVLTLAVAIIFGLAPVISAYRVEANTALQGRSRSSTDNLLLQTMRQGFVAAQVAFSLVLLVGAGLLGRSFLQVWMTDPGFDPENLVTARAGGDVAAYIPILEQLQAIPGVTSVALSNAVPGSSDIGAWLFDIEGRPVGDAPLHSQGISVSPEYFETLRLPLIDGRTFTASDVSEGAPVVVVNEAFAAKFFPGESAIGKGFRTSELLPPQLRGSGPNPWIEIIGVVGDIRQHTLEREPELMAYANLLSEPDGFVRGPVVRSAGDPSSVAAAVQAILRANIKDQPVYDLTTVEESFGAALAPRRFSTLLVGALAAVALVLAAIGIYGMVAYLVAKRTMEMGIRMALGAQPGQLVRMVMGEGLWLGIIGMVVGLVGAFALTRFLESLLLNVSTTDPVVYSLLALLLLLIATVAAVIPARRAAAADPAQVLRHD